MSSVRDGDLYDTLSIPRTASQRKVRRLARRIRRCEPESLSRVANVAEEVLGDVILRARYDRVLDRLRAANVPIPSIGNVVVGRLPRSAARRSSTVALRAKPAVDPPAPAPRTVPTPPAVPPPRTAPAPPPPRRSQTIPVPRIGANLKPDTSVIKIVIVAVVGFAIVAIAVLA